MKKLLLTGMIAMATLASFAQRTIDWETLSINSPDSMRSTATNTPINLTFTMKNNGPDAVNSGDSVLFQFGITNTNPQIYYPGPGASQFRIQIIGKTYASGDTMQITIPGLSVNLVAPTSINANLRVISFVRGGNITNEVAPAINNNTITKTVVWYNQYGNGVGLGELFKNVNVKVYPNPAKDVLNIETNYGKEVVINIYDITGKKVESIRNNEQITKINVAEFNKGFYMYEIKTTSNDLIKSGKFSVAH
jgi:hypothetical protein